MLVSDILNSCLFPFENKEIKAFLRKLDSIFSLKCSTIDKVSCLSFFQEIIRFHFIANRINFYKFQIIFFIRTKNILN